MYQQGQTQKKVGEYNAKMNEYAAQDAQKRGELQAIEARRRGEAMKGAQRVSMAAKGLDLSEGTAQQIQDTTDFFSETDQNTARYNAAKDAWSARQSGQLARWQGQAQAQQSNLQAFSTALGSAGSVASKWYTPSSAGTQPAAPIVDLSFRK
jgi:hypothetical protein